MKCFVRVVVLCTLVACAFAGCNRSEPAASGLSTTPAPIAEVSVEQASALLAAGAIAIDANGEDTRREQGTVPNARLLSSSSQYDPARELPAARNTKLVFYCGGEMCSASDTAAERARSAGFTDVCGMRPGISGWVSAGKTTQSFPRS